jgi:hypothetical protein
LGWIQGSRHEGFDLFGLLYFRAEAVLDLKPEEDDNDAPNSPYVLGLTRSACQKKNARYFFC